MTETRTPKILPWLARKAGISNERAEALWREAVCHATVQIGRAGNPDYYRAVMKRLLELVERERSLAPAGQPLPFSLPLRHRPSGGNDAGGDPTARHGYDRAWSKLPDKRCTVASAICVRHLKCVRILG